MRINNEFSVLSVLPVLPVLFEPTSRRVLSVLSVLSTKSTKKKKFAKWVGSRFQTCKNNSNCQKKLLLFKKLTVAAARKNTRIK